MINIFIYIYIFAYSITTDDCPSKTMYFAVYVNRHSQERTVGNAARKHREIRIKVTSAGVDDKYDAIVLPQ